MAPNLWILWKTQDSRLWNLWITSRGPLSADRVLAIIGGTRRACERTPCNLDTCHSAPNTCRSSPQGVLTGPGRRLLASGNHPGESDQVVLSTKQPAKVEVSTARWKARGANADSEQRSCIWENRRGKRDSPDVETSVDNSEKPTSGR
jgi:hypothetical protein